jgi:nucleoside phosphorylase
LVEATETLPREQPIENYKKPKVVLREISLPYLRPYHSASMSNPNDYTVGWICAISTEHVAALAILDEEHEQLEYLSPNDNNNYTLGKIGKHNVVIAVLPPGECNTSSAAIVATHMLHSFPNVAFVLMVVIGGGAPSRYHDIRLGDIVVGASRDGKGGVFQYDLGKTIQDQRFQNTGFSREPPTILRTAVNELMAQYESKGHRLEELINGILEKNPRLRKKYKRPDPSSDRLYRTEITHPPDAEASCAVVCGDSSSELVLRLKRTEEEDNPAIHYGLIASANQLMKDAIVRDGLAAEKGVLCFDVGAAGVMNHFPCLVILGICNYSDSHKYKEWQGYAAMAAAAYAKDLLYRIPPNKIEAEKRIRDILSDQFEETSVISATGFSRYVSTRTSDPTIPQCDRSETHVTICL